jgi:parvulin-like peptidyl-prolyl isomerase
MEENGWHIVKVKHTAPQEQREATRSVIERSNVMYFSDVQNYYTLILTE